MSWLGGRREQWGDEPHDDAHNSWRDQNRPEDDHPPHTRAHVHFSLLSHIKRTLGRRKHEDALILAAILICWVLTIGSQSELGQILNWLAAAGATLAGAWWLYHRLKLSWITPHPPVSQEAIESGMGPSINRGPKLRIAKRTVYSLTATAVALSVATAISTEPTRVGATTSELSAEIVQLDMTVRNTASGSDPDAVRRAWMLAGARPTTSGITVTGVHGKRVWLQIAGQGNPTTVCLEIGDANTPAVKSTCAGLATGITRGPGGPASR